MQKNKIGLGLITCDRHDFFKQSYDSVKENYDISFVIVDDGTTNVRDLIEWGEDNNAHYIQTKGKEGVAVAKNKALKYLMDCECEHLFLMEDDIIIKDQNVFNAYINTSKATGIKHFNFGLHGNHNLDQNGNPILLKTINYGHTSIDLYFNVLGAFSYYHADTINKCGYMDEYFYNALEHVDHTYQIIKAGYHPPFRWFADINGSKNYIQDIVKNHEQSKIRSQDDFMKTFIKALDYFLSKNKFSVVNGYGKPETIASEKEVIANLKEIYNESR